MVKSDDEDAFLYGSDDEEEVEQTRKKQKTINTEAAIVSKPSGESLSKDDKQASKKDEAGEDQADEDEGDEEEDDNEDEESEDDIDIIIGDTAATAPSTSSTTTSGPISDAIDSVVDLDAEGSKAPTTTIVTKDLTENKTTIDVHAVAEYEGKRITLIDLETIKEKPWRAPGADISDYFNYGFDEFTWTAYCSKHDKLRGEFNPQKLMAQIMAAQQGSNQGKSQMSPPPGFPPLGMMPPGMPPMGMMGNMPMPPGMNMPMPPNMPNMGMPSNLPKNPNLSNMPGLPNMPAFPNMQNFMKNNRQGQK